MKSKVYRLPKNDSFAIVHIPRGRMFACISTPMAEFRFEVDDTLLLQLSFMSFVRDMGIGYDRATELYRQAETPIDKVAFASVSAYYVHRMILRPNPLEMKAALDQLFIVATERARKALCPDE